MVDYFNGKFNQMHIVVVIVNICVNKLIFNENIIFIFIVWIPINFILDAFDNDNVFCVRNINDIEQGYIYFISTYQLYFIFVSISSFFFFFIFFSFFFFFALQLLSGYFQDETELTDLLRLYKCMLL